MVAADPMRTIASIVNAFIHVAHWPPASYPPITQNEAWTSAAKPLTAQAIGDWRLTTQPMINLI